MKDLLPRRNRYIGFYLALFLSIPAVEVYAEPVKLAHDASSIAVTLSADGREANGYLDGIGKLEPQTVQQNPVAPTQQVPTPAPVGTAAAPDEQPAGVAASKPSGSAIAPAKQRRIRTYAIRTALVLGAAVAIGVVVGASLASPTRAQ